MKYQSTAKLVVICITLLIALLFFKDSLHEFHFKNKEVSVDATFVAYEVRK
ncbi:Hok/Gef family protein [Vibrio algicola]|uniref:Hok/Gef family protein n=1 Tax=Vibrio algicola TaxID=2662262 RepID=UPI0015B4EC9B